MVAQVVPPSFADLVFIGERIKVGLRRGKFDYLALMNRKPGENGKNKKDGGTHVVIVVPTWPNFPPTQQYQPFSLPTTLSARNTQSSTKATPKLAIKPACRTSDTKNHP